MEAFNGGHLDFSDYAYWTTAEITGATYLGEFYAGTYITGEDMAMGEWLGTGFTGFSRAGSTAFTAFGHARAFLPNNIKIPATTSLMDQMSPDEAIRYRNYWERHAPESSKPFDMYPLYTEDGRLKQMTTYDEFGDRHRQYDLIDPRREEHQYNFQYCPVFPRPKGARSDHLPIDE